jgi:hypothetical protein
VLAARTRRSRSRMPGGPIFTRQMCQIYDRR